MVVISENRMGISGSTMISFILFLLFGIFDEQWSQYESCLSSNIYIKSHRNLHTFLVISSQIINKFSSPLKSLKFHSIGPNNRIIIFHPKSSILQPYNPLPSAYPDSLKQLPHFNFYYQQDLQQLMRTSQPSEPKLTRTKSHEERIVYRLTKNTNMKFRPERTVEDQQQSSGIMERIKSLSRLFSRTSTDSFKKSSQEAGKSSVEIYESLRFLFRLDSDSYLIGNRLQLDALSISIVDDYIETDHLWVLRLKSPILNLIVDDRRRTIIAVVVGQILIYSYEGKRSKNAPTFQKSLRMIGEIKMIQLAKDSLLTVFLDSTVQSYILDGANSRQNLKKQYKVQKDLTLYQLAQCIQNVLNVFFSSPCVNNPKFFQLWCMSIDIMPDKMVMGEVKKIYDIQMTYKDTLKVQCITKDSFFMNLGQDILLFRKGYCVDKIFINLKLQGTLLKYFGDKKLIHIAPKQIDFYSFTIDLVSNPPRMSIHSNDSITNVQNQKYAFIDAIKLQDHKIAFFYQNPTMNNSGEVKYIFNLTQKWNYQEKISSILPSIAEYQGKYEGPEFQELQAKVEFSCDAVGKMGMTRKEAYLRIWRQSKKEHIEEFKFLLDTHDYNTIREEILLKLRKKAMALLQVHKMQSGCMSMIAENLFSAKKYSIQEFKNYLTSHFLIRKLELFKEIRLYEKRTGKIKMTESQKNDKSKDKLLINIQEYTNAIGMDIKAYLIQLIYNFIKYKKDLITEIRIVIKKFKFALLYVYDDLLKTIVNTAKEDLLFLLTNIPELLPFTHSVSVESHEQAALLTGLWGDFKEQEWDNALILQNVVTIYNKEMILQFQSNLWIKRNWLTYHDLIFLNKSSLKEIYSKFKAESLFYNLIEHIYDNYSSQAKIDDLVRYLEDTYVLFPPHLFNTVQLYRELFLYFKENQVLNESFNTFLRRIDQQIFKKIFDHQKFKKGSFLKQIKPIYENLRHSDKFNVGLLKYFSSNLSEVSDIKYLLNRINNEKRQFHAENEEMYEVLVKGMQIKLKLGSEKDIPMSQVLIYIENIPLTDDNPVSKELKTLQKINEEGERFKKMKLNMSVFEMIRNRDSVLLNAIAYEIDTSGVRSSREESFVLDSSKQIIDNLTRIRKNIYGPFRDNAILFIYLIKLLESIELAPFVPAIIKQSISEECEFDNGHLENVVFYCYRQKVMNEPKYENASEYLHALVSLLPEDNYLRIFINCQLELASIFSKAGISVQFPICGERGILTQVELSGLIQGLKGDALLEVNIVRVHELADEMQRILGASRTTLYELYEIYFMCLMRRGLLQKAILQVENMVKLQPSNVNNIVYPILIFKWVSNQFTEENKQIMVNLLINFFSRPLELIKIFQELLSRSFSNQGQRQFLSQRLNQNIVPPSECIKADNPLFTAEIASYLQQFPQKCDKFVQLFQKQYQHLVHSQQEFQKSVDVLIFHFLIVREPIVLIKYIALNKFMLNFKEVRSFISHLCKYEAYDQIKLLEFGKRMFKLIYDVQKGEGNYQQLIEEVLSTPLLETRTIDVLDTATDNLTKIVKCIDKMKTKLKLKMSASLKKKSSVIRQPGNNKIQLFLSDHSVYFSKSEYIFNDSDGYVDKKETLNPNKFIQGNSSEVFSFKKYLTWMFSRTNQQIQYYLIKANEAEADQAIKKQEEALKLSFRKTSNERINKETAHVVAKTYTKFLKTETEEKIEDIIMPPISAIPIVPSSAISVGQIWTEQIQQVYIGTSLLKDQIIANMTINEDKILFDTKLLNSKFRTALQLQNALPELVKEIYLDSNLEYAISVGLMREIYNCYPKITPLNVGFLEVYGKVEQLQKKLALGLQTRDLLPFEGLLLKEKDNGVLFSFVKPYILPHLNENNIHTLSRILSLSFKKPELQQEIINEFFKIIVKEYSQLESLFDENMKLEKIVAFAQKMPLNHLKLEVQKIIEVIVRPEKKRKIVAAIGDILRQRNDAKSAEQLEAKWLEKVGSPQEVQ